MCKGGTGAGRDGVRRCAQSQAHAASTEPAEPAASPSRSNQIQSKQSPSEVTSISSSVSCLAMSTLETTLRNRRAPGAPIECANRNESGYGEQSEPARISMLDGER